MSQTKLTEYRFSVYKHPIVLGANLDKLIYRQFIVLVDPDGLIIAFTKFHNYIHSRNKRGAKHITDNGNNRFDFIADFLNYIFFHNQIKYQIQIITEITLNMLKDFFNDYGTLGNRIKNTVDRCVISIMDFLEDVIQANPGRCALKKSDFIVEEIYRNKRGEVRYRNKLTFEVFYSKNKKKIFRDIPNSVFNILLSFAATYYKDIFFLIVLCSFAGLRPAESCNVSQLYYKMIRVNGKLSKVNIDLLEERPMRADLVNVGGIKKPRIQGVYTKFLQAFDYCYNLHMRYLQDKMIDKQYLPMNVNSRGIAQTKNNFYSRFRKLIAEIIPRLLESGDPEVVEYGLSLQENNISPHIFRHWFSVRLTLYGEDIAGLQHWRADSSPSSSLTYLQNKGELAKQLEFVNNGIFDATQLFAELQRKKGNKYGC